MRVGAGDEHPDRRIVFLKGKFIKRDAGKIVAVLVAEYVGMFRIHPEMQNMDLDQFSTKNAPAILFPYLRQTFHEMLLHGGLPVSVIPPLNVNLLFPEE
ncbi:MAG: protein-export chaperone SecB [Spirochaetales bacterium]|nr:protein-export chaperone SecB [Spirochaetales bacterium]